MQSGSAHQEWSLVSETVKNSRVIAEALKCPVHNSYEMVNCLRTRNPYFVVYHTMNTFVRNFPKDLAA